MATITNRRLTLTPGANNTIITTVKCRVNFNPFEMAHMLALPAVSHYQLRCQLWGRDTIVGEDLIDDLRFIYPIVKFFPDATPTASEDFAFTIVLPRAFLNEDVVGLDEIYGRLTLRSHHSLVPVAGGRTNTVSIFIP